MAANGDAVALRDELLHLIAGGPTAPLADDEFDDLARRIFKHQFERNTPYRAYCQRRGVSPDGVERWTDIPAVPTDAFKAVPLVSGEPPAAEVIFRTSGTTGGPGRRGEHHLLNLDLYDAALRAGFRAHLLPDDARLPILSLVPPFSQTGDSSLSYMLDSVLRDLGGEDSRGFVTARGLDLDLLMRRLRDAEAAQRPVLLAGTSLSFVHLLEALEQRDATIALPPGSRVMDTGGSKGRSREMSRDELYSGLRQRLGIPARWCVNEYGMTEMSSQLYDAVAGDLASEDLDARAHVAPSWVRSVAADPERLRPLPAGETGVLRHCDLANLYSVMALQTADLGRVTAEGIQIFGRARGAEARGCSIAADELLSAARMASP